MKFIVRLCVVLLVLAVSVSFASSPPDSTSQAVGSAAPAVVSAPVSPDSATRSPIAKPAPKRPPHGHPGAGDAKRPAPRDTLSAEELNKLHLPASPPPPKGRAPRVTGVALDVRHQVFGNFHERVVVGMRDEFRIGDSDYIARIIGFVPDWSMGLKDFKVYNRSNEPNNPGFRIVVKEKGVVRDTVWALLNMPPHFAPRSMLSFKVLRIEFADHAPVPRSPADSTAWPAARKPDSTAVPAGKR